MAARMARISPVMDEIAMIGMVVGGVPSMTPRFGGNRRDRDKTQDDREKGSKGSGLRQAVQQTRF
jgi:hypothetical protein